MQSPLRRASRLALCGSKLLAFERSFTRTRGVLYKTVAVNKACLTTAVSPSVVPKSIVDVDHSVHDRLVTLTLQHGQRAVYPVVWLRDSCLCDKCHNASSMSRILLAKNLNPRDELTSISVSDDGESLLCEWSDGHRSEFPAEWLRGKSFYPHEQLARLKADIPAPELWDARDYRIQTYKYDELMSDDTLLLDFLCKLWSHGLTIVQGCPPKDTITQLTARAANSRIYDTNYGRTFDVISLPNPNNVAYTNKELGMHTDLPDLERAPEIQILHCIRQSSGEGGENQFADGFYVAKLLKQKNPAAYDLLSTVPVDFHDIGTSEYDFHLKCRRPVIELDADGEISCLYYSQHNRDYTLNVPLAKVQPLFDALIELNKMF